MAMLRQKTVMFDERSPDEFHECDDLSPSADVNGFSHLKYLQYLRKADNTPHKPKSCLPPLTFRALHGKYRETSSPSASPEISSAPESRAQTSLDVAGPHTSSWSADSRKRENVSAFSDRNWRTFPKEFWEGPMFKVYKEAPDLKMTLPRVKALKSLLRIQDFESKTGFSETAFAPEELIVFRTTRRRKGSFMPARGGESRLSIHTLARVSSSVSTSKKQTSNKLPTIMSEG